MAQIIDSSVRPGCEEIFASSLDELHLRDAWTTLTDLCDQAVSGNASLGEVSATLHTQDGEILTFARTILSQPTWYDLACLFARLCEGIASDVSQNAAVQFVHIKITDDVTLTLEGKYGPADQESNALLDMLNTYCLAHLVVVEQGADVAKALDLGVLLRDVQEGLQGLAVEGRYAYATASGMRVTNDRQEWRGLIPWPVWELLRDRGLVEASPEIPTTMSRRWRISDAGRAAIA